MDQGFPVHEHPVMHTPFMSSRHWKTRCLLAATIDTALLPAAQQCSAKIRVFLCHDFLQTAGITERILS